ncbi:hypothetical protein CEXT_86731 [Caerostris extrusa]|uniref:Uncharacterized protein n=1 Tax=Caerostris extrusa TaxID=172846 RepID=A0AAV4XGF4_CAEEX|nr:hypothetical protein CEXT_86731 [Caerostris extrusa]
MKPSLDEQKMEQQFSKKSHVYQLSMAELYPFCTSKVREQDCARKSVFHQVKVSQRTTDGAQNFWIFHSKISEAMKNKKRKEASLFWIDELNDCGLCLGETLPTNSPSSNKFAFVVVEYLGKTFCPTQKL